MEENHARDNDIVKPTDPRLLKRMKDMNFSTRTINGILAGLFLPISFFNRDNVVLGDLLAQIDKVSMRSEKPVATLLRIPHIGEKSVQEIKEKLESIGLRLDMRLDPFEWQANDIKPTDPRLFKRVKDVDFPIYIQNQFSANNIVFVGDLVQKQRVSFKPTFWRIFNYKTLQESLIIDQESRRRIKQALESMGLRLDPRLDGWQANDIDFTDPRFLKHPSLWHKSIQRVEDESMRKIQRILESMDLRLNMRIDGWNIDHRPETTTPYPYGKSVDLLF